MFWSYVETINYLYQTEKFWDLWPCSNGQNDLLGRPSCQILHERGSRRLKFFISLIWTNAYTGFNYADSNLYANPREKSINVFRKNKNWLKMQFLALLSTGKQVHNSKYSPSFRIAHTSTEYDGSNQPKLWFHFSPSNDWWLDYALESQKLDARNYFLRVTLERK